MDKLSYRAPALDKGLDIIELLAVTRVGLTQAQIASHLKKSVNEIYRMLNTLKERGYLEFNEVTDQYKLSYKLLNLASTFSPTKSLLEKARYFCFILSIKCKQVSTSTIFWGCMSV